MPSDVLWRRVKGGRVLHAFEEWYVGQWCTGSGWIWSTACDADFASEDQPPDRGDRPRCKRCEYEIGGSDAE